MDEYFSQDLSSRQLATILHTLYHIESTPDDIVYLKSEEFFEDNFPIDLIIFKPTKVVDYYIIQTVGLSSYYFQKNISRCELMMLLPKTFKFDFEKSEYNWVRELLLDIAYGVVENNMGVMVGQVYVPNEEEVYEGSPDIVGGIVVLPEQFGADFYDEEIDGFYTKFLQIVPVSKDGLSKIEEVGPAKFIEYDLHSAEGPQFVVQLKEKKLEGIEKIIKENEDALKD